MYFANKQTAYMKIIKASPKLKVYLFLVKILRILYVISLKILAQQNLKKIELELYRKRLNNEPPFLHACTMFMYETHE